MTDQVQVNSSSGNSFLTNMMSNKNYLHVCLEVVALLGLTVYFSSKNKKLVGHIEELSQKMEEQEEQIQKLQSSIKQLTQNFEGFASQISQSLNQTNNNLNMLKNMTTMNLEQTRPKPKNTKQVLRDLPKQRSNVIPNSNVVISTNNVEANVSSNTKVSSNTNVSSNSNVSSNTNVSSNILLPTSNEHSITKQVTFSNEVLEDDKNSDSELDDLIKEELEELENNTENSLKKQA
jgi:hypothetical protein